MNLNAILAKNCKICQTPVEVSEASIKSHYSFCSTEHKVQCRFLLTRLIINTTSICYQCGDEFEEQQWKKHSKRRHKLERETTQIHFDYENRSQRISTISTSYSAPATSNLVKSLSNIAYQYTSANVPLWISLNNYVSTKSLSNYFMLKLGINMGQVLTSKVPIITEKQIRALHIKQLKNVKPEELANSTFVDNLLPRLTPHNQFKIITFLNKKAKQTGNFEIRPLPKLDRQKKAFKPVKFSKLIHFLSALITSGKKQIIHLGLDLLIIFQTGVRFLSDYELLQKQILENKPTIHLKINKTKGEAKISLPLQTLELISQFKWPGWSKKTIKLYKSMRSWSGIRGYSLKYTLLTYLYMIKPGQINLSQTGHKTFENVLPYLNVIQNQLNREGLASSQIPELLKTTNTWQNVERISNELFIGMDESYQQISPDFLMKLISLVYKTKQQYENDEFTLFNKSMQKIPFPETHGSQQQAIKDADEDSASIMQTASNRSQYLVFGENVDNFEQHLLQDIGQNKACIFCSEIYHPPLCKCLNSKPCVPLKSQTGEKKLDINITIPQSYFSNQYDPEYLKIRRLIALRRFKYVQEATCTFQEFSVDPEPKMSFESKQYQRIRRETYFPPLKLKKIGTKFLSTEDSFGLVAQADIEPYTLIGEYAGDIISCQHLQCTRRLDMTMNLTVLKGVSLTIAPVISMGYVCLINTGQSNQQNNCKSLKVQINGETKVIVYTFRKIKTQEQLLYDYGDSFKIKFNSHLISKEIANSNTKDNSIPTSQCKTASKKKRNSVNVKKHKNQSSYQLEEMNKPFQNDLYFKNSGTDCYKNVVIVAFWQVFQRFQIFQRCFKQKSTKSLDAYFNLPSGQQDCSQFLIQVLKNKQIYESYYPIYRNCIEMDLACSACRKTGLAIDNFDYLPTESDFGLIEADLQRVQCPLDYYCEKCYEVGKTSARRSVRITGGKIVLMRKTMQVTRFEPQIKLDNKFFQFEGAITYAGDGNTGHYMYFNGQKYISDDVTFLREEVPFRPYMAIYKLSDAKTSSTGQQSGIRK